MEIYHGSPVVVDKPELSKGKLANDYGQGFYCTENIEMARECACRGKEPPAFANVYELKLEGLNVLELRNSVSPASEIFANDIVRMGLRQGDDRIREILST